MPIYEGTYPYLDDQRKPGILLTELKYAPNPQHGWMASFLFDQQEVPSGVTFTVIYDQQAHSEQQAYDKSIQRGFLPHDDNETEK